MKQKLKSKCKLGLFMIYTSKPNIVETLFCSTSDEVGGSLANFLNLELIKKI